MALEKLAKSRTGSRPNDWTDVLAPEIIRQFEGKHIAIVYKRVVASGTTFESVLEECLLLFPEETPYLAYIPTPEEMAVDDAPEAASTLGRRSSVSVSKNIVPVQANSLAVVPKPAPVAATPAAPAEPAEPVIAAPEPVIAAPAAQESVPDPQPTEVVVPVAPVLEAVRTLEPDQVAEPADQASEPIPVAETIETTAQAQEADTDIHLPTDDLSAVQPELVPVAEVSGQPVIEDTPIESVAQSLPSNEPDSDSASGDYPLTPTEPAPVVEPRIEAAPMVETVVDVPAAPAPKPRSRASASRQAPSFSGFSPLKGPAGTLIALTGTSMRDVTGVYFGDIPADTFNRVSDSVVSAPVPESASTAVITLVFGEASISSQDVFTVVHPPTVTSFAPAKACPGTFIKISGTHLSQASQVIFEGLIQAPVISATEDTVEVEIPANALSGKFCVTTSGGTCWSDTRLNIIAMPPLIERLSSTAGPAGSRVSVIGQNLIAVSGVYFGQTSAEHFTEITDNELMVEVPVGAKSGPISIVCEGGEAVSGETFVIKIQPTISSFTPETDGIGAKVLLTGSHLAGAKSVSFNNVSASRYTVISQTFMTAVVPPDATTGTISVVTPGGVAYSENEFAVVAPPVIGQIDPVSGPAGTKVTIVGQNFLGTTSVTLNNEPVLDFVVESNSLLSFKLTDDSDNGILKITGPGGSSEIATNFAVVPMPTITAFAPAFGSAGTVVTVTGTNLENAVAAFVNEAKANVSAVTGSSATVFVPNDATSGPISIRTPVGYCTSDTEFEVITPLAIKDIAPPGGPAGATVNIIGWGFKLATSVMFGGIPSPSITVNSNNSITAQVPYGAQTGDVVVLGSTGAAVSVKPYNVTLTVISIRPSSGPGATSITISGVGLASATAVTFDGINAEFEIISDTTLFVIAPPGTSDGPIEVITPLGSTLSPVNYIYQLP